MNFYSNDFKTLAFGEHTINLAFSENILPFDAD